MKGPLDVHRELLAREVSHEIVHLPRVVLTADEVPGVLGLPPTACVAVRGYLLDRAGDDRLVVVAVPAGRFPDAKRVAVALDPVDPPPLRPATSTEISVRTRYRAGLLPPIGLPDDTVVLADAAVGAAPVLYVPTGDGGTVLGIRTRDLLVVSRARVTSLLPDVATTDLDSDADVDAGLPSLAAAPPAVARRRASALR